MSLTVESLAANKHVVAIMMAMPVPVLSVSIRYCALPSKVAIDIPPVSPPLIKRLSVFEDGFQGKRRSQPLLHSRGIVGQWQGNGKVLRRHVVHRSRCQEWTRRFEQITFRFFAPL
jgi:hypothetical protein